MSDYLVTSGDSYRKGIFYEARHNVFNALPYERCPEGFFHGCQEWCAGDCENWPTGNIQATSKSELSAGSGFDPFCHPCQEWCNDSCEDWFEA